MPSRGEGGLGWGPFWPEGRVGSELASSLRMEGFWMGAGPGQTPGSEHLGERTFDLRVLKQHPELERAPRDVRFGPCFSHQPSTLDRALSDPKLNLDPNSRLRVAQ